MQDIIQEYNKIGAVLTMKKVSVRQGFFEEETFNLKPKELGIHQEKNWEE